MRRQWISCSLLALVAGCADGAPADDVDVVGNVKLAPADGSAAPAALPDDPAMIAKPDGPLLGAVKMAVSIYERPDHRSNKIGYLRVGVRLPRADKPAAFDSCQGGFYNVLPKGYVCLDDGASIDMQHVLLRAELRQADYDKPLPYDYGFVRAIAPRYYRLPSEKEQLQYEMSLESHLRSFRRLEEKWQAVDVGSNDVRMLPDGVVLGPPPDEPPALDKFHKFGGDDGKVPWFFDGGRQLPNISNFKVPDYVVMTNRIKRHAGVALIDAFAGDNRNFALTTDLRLIPMSKLKPARGSTFHGVELKEGWALPLGFVKRDSAYKYERNKGRYKRIKQRLAYGKPLQLTGEVKRDGSRRYVELDDGNFALTKDLAIVVKESKLPSLAKKGVRWIDVSILRQVLTLYDGSDPIYATMVSTGKDGLGEPGKTHSTPRGTFTIRDKHMTATMDSQTLGEEFELNDVPWVQYFQAGYALHAAYWHTEYGRPRSHGCINLSPIDAYRIFHWTEPELPHNWHGVDASETMGAGTIVHVRP